MAVEVFKLFGSIFVNNDEANASISKTNEKASNTASTFSKGIKTAAKWGVAIVGGTSAAAGGMMKFAQTTASTADNVDKMSQKIGISRQTYQELDFICSQSGTSVDKLQTGMKTLRNAMTGDKNAEIFQNLGVSLTDASGQMKSSEQVMWETMSALQGVADADEKAAIAQKLFGKSGSDLMPLLNGAPGSIDEMKQKAHDLGLVMSDDVIDSGVGLTDSLDQIKRAFAGVKNQLGAAFMPILKQVADKMQDFLPYIQQAISEITPILSEMFENIMPVLGEMAENLLPVLFEAFQQLLPVFQEIVMTVLPIILDLITQLAPLFAQIIEQLLPLFVEFIQQIAPLLIQFVSQVLPLIVQLIQQLLPFIVQIVEQILPILVQMFQQILPIVTQIITAILPVLISLLTQLLPPVLQIVQSILPLFLQLFDSIMPLILNLTDLLLPILVQLFEFLTPLIKTVATLFGDNLSKAIDSCSKILEPFISLFDNLIKFITNVFQGNWEDAWNNVVEIFKSIFNLIPTFVENVINAVIGAVNGIIDGINWVAGWTGIHIDNIPEVDLPRFRAGIDFVPSDNYPVALDYGEAVLTASEAEEYRQSKRNNGVDSPFKSTTDEPKQKIINQTFNVSVKVEKISDNFDLQDLAIQISEALAEQVQEAEIVYA